MCILFTYILVVFGLESVCLLEVDYSNVMPLLLLSFTMLIAVFL